MNQQANRYRIPCRYIADDLDLCRGEAIAFVCGAVAATTGAPVDYGYPDRTAADEGRFDVWITCPVPPPAHHVERWRAVVARDLARVLMEPGAAVEIGEPELIAPKRVDTPETEQNANGEAQR